LFSRISIASITTILICTITWSCTKNSRDTREEKIKFQQYYVKGEQLYGTYCSNCHQKDGSGLGTLYPPLNNSDYMVHNNETVLCIIRYGMKGEVMVNGKIFNKEMPALPMLSDLEIAEIATYIFNTWDHREGLIDVGHASELLKKCEQ
jgi:cytochrome c551